ncbi:holo-[acyl-carrier-protein] synthase [candidate division WOR-3 bacterium]|uniref:Holo-[acyl-carrier-protein] synthase n=1 Tax=candidate division WOR-3 bacterium TaxID=2052148 RepID=A0A9D5KA79_UNCW3|nr:holo-[acyl-carrier-protein] synthase [candidate division WOR-3 bacterium]MBD3364940.1 holo-[acyl-carrier-protein] synthase [candidate division WOR-3 bacterium]
MIFGIGIDIIEVARIRKAYTKLGKRFLSGVFTEAEQKFSLKHRDPAERLAARWAAKEAVAKALGTGFARGVKPLDFEIIDNERSRPTVNIKGKASNYLGQMKVHLSISHIKDYATAVAVIEKE